MLLRLVDESSDPLALTKLPESPLDVDDVTAIPLVAQGVLCAVPVVSLGVVDGSSDPVALIKLPESPLEACVVPSAPVAGPSLLAAEMLVS